MKKNLGLTIRESLNSAIGNEKKQEEIKSIT